MYIHVCVITANIDILHVHVFSGFITPALPITAGYEWSLALFYCPCLVRADVSGNKVADESLMSQNHSIMVHQVYNVYLGGVPDKYSLLMRATCVTSLKLETAALACLPPPRQCFSRIIVYTCNSNPNVQCVYMCLCSQTPSLLSLVID